MIGRMLHFQSLVTLHSEELQYQLKRLNQRLKKVTVTKNSNQVLKSDTHPESTTNDKSTDGSKNNKSVNRKGISRTTNSKCADSSKNSDNSLIVKEISNTISSISANDLRNSNKTLNEKEISNITNSKFADGSKGNHNSLNVKEISNNINNVSTDVSENNVKFLNKKEISPQTDCPLNILVMQITSEKAENCEDADGKESAKIIVSPVTIESGNANNIPIQIVSVQSLVPPKKQISTNGLVNITQYPPIKPKPPGYQAPVPVTEAHSKQKKVLRKRKSVISHKCDICDKNFTRAYAVFRHKREIHNVQIDYVSLHGKSSEYLCRTCKKPFSTFQNRRRHEKNFHQFDVPYKRNYKCSECLSVISGKKAIVDHISEIHSNIDLKSETKTFNSLEEFKKWKDKIEKDTASQYVQNNTYQCKDSKNMKYVCHRSGPFISHGSGKRNLKFNGSNKTGFFCPAYMHVKTSTVENSNVEVSFILAHLGHECEIERIKMEKRLKSPQNGKLHQCRVCGKIFTESNNRRSHEKNVHALDTKYELELKCPKCFSIFPSRKKIIHHISKLHPDVKFETLHLTFNSSGEFEQWKSATEETTTSEYVLDLAYRKNVYSVRRFDCHLSGASETGLFCPASMLVKSRLINDKSIIVTFLATHVGHGSDIQDMQVDKSPSVQNDKVINEYTSVKNNHQAAENIVDDVIVVQTDKSTWTILPFLNEKKSFEVKKLDIDFGHTCEIKCLSCNACQHQFTCSCSDPLLKNDICSHIHIVSLKYYQMNEEDNGDNCYFEDCISYSDQEDTSELENSILQEIRGNLRFKNLREQAVSELSELLVEISECRDEIKLKELIEGISILKNKISSSPSVPSTSSQMVCEQKQSPIKKKRKMEKNCHLDQNRDDLLEQIIVVTQSNSPNLIQTSNYD